MSEAGLRIDKWLWAVRLFKTRSIASEACRSGKVKLGDQPVKPSHVVRQGDEINLWFPPVLRTVKVIELTSNRVSAKLVSGFLLDLTPDSEYEKLRLKKEAGFEFRPAGLGRPTKRQRREIELLKQYFDR
jgi:ribosome-associated heat shock protein Hsp15